MTESNRFVRKFIRPRLFVDRLFMDCRSMAKLRFNWKKNSLSKYKNYHQRHPNHPYSNAKPLSALFHVQGRVYILSRAYFRVCLFPEYTHISSQTSYFCLQKFNQTLVLMHYTLLRDGKKGQHYLHLFSSNNYHCRRSAVCPLAAPIKALLFSWYFTTENSDFTHAYRINQEWFEFFDIKSF